MAKFSLLSVYLCVVMAVLSLRSVYSEPINVICTQLCDKQYFTLNCEDYPNDVDCKNNCKLCTEICIDHSPKKFYNCPQGTLTSPNNADNSRQSPTHPNSSQSSSSSDPVTIICFIAAAMAVILVIVGAFCCTKHCSRRNTGNTALVEIFRERPQTAVNSPFFN